MLTYIHILLSDKHKTLSPPHKKIDYVQHLENMICKQKHSY